MSESVVMHVTCPIRGCHKIIETNQQESWGQVDPRDHGCINITVTDDAVRQHIQSHSAEEIIASAPPYTDEKPYDWQERGDLPTNVYQLVSDQRKMWSK